MPTLVIINKGGPGSGHHGHTGLPGVWGGSMPGKRRDLSPGNIIDAPTSSDKLEELWDVISKWNESSGKRIALNAIDDMMSKANKHQGLMAIDGDDVIGVLSYRVYDDYVKINNVGTSGGAGKTLVMALKDRFPNNVIRAEATVGARSFYEHIGMELEEGTANIYILKGGPGSGHRGHSGRPGKVGGSVPRGGSASAYANIGAWPPTSYRTETSPKIVAYKPPAETTGEIYTDEPVDMQWINTHMRGVFGSMTPAQAEVIKNYLVDNKIPRSHLYGLRHISHDAPKDYRDGAMAWRDKNTGQTVAAVYYFREKAIYIHPSQSNNTAASLFHEIGHHITKQGAINMNRPHDISKHSKKITNELKGMNLRSWELAGTYGLRPYSLDDWQECFADSYSVLRTGRTHKDFILHDEAIGNLKSLWGDAPDSVKEVLGI